LGSYLVDIQAYLISAIADTAATTPTKSPVQLYQFALFLKSSPVPAGEIIEDILTDEALSETQFAAIYGDKFAALLAALIVEFGYNKEWAVLVEHGAYTEHP
jgi:hypothetical protein